MNKWTWRIVLVCLVVFLSMGFYKISFQAFNSFFTGLLISDFSYPKARISVEKGSDDFLSMVVVLEPYAFIPPNAADPFDLSIRVTAPSIGILVSADEERVNGYPFFHSLIKKDDLVTIEYLHRKQGEDIVYDKKEIASLQLEKPEPAMMLSALKGAALEASSEKTSPRLAFFQWGAVGILVMLGGLYGWLKIRKRIFSP